MTLHPWDSGHRLQSTGDRYTGTPKGAWGENCPGIVREDNGTVVGFKRNDAGRAPPSPWSKTGFAGFLVNSPTEGSCPLQDLD
jgi:hypothetical protein